MNEKEKIINEIEVLLTKLKKEINSPTIISKDVKNKIVIKNNFSGLTKEIFNLINEGFFDNSKELYEIQKKLKENGINKPSSRLMKPILQLIRKKILGRNKPEKGTYQYYKRS
ncbi:MAG: hypothetical protein PHN69_06875 [Candidatus Pacebacteria bacterium]|nr:hypothetical protein [Candidatus Paceibacterota bacterium]